MYLEDLAQPNLTTMAYNQTSLTRSYVKDNIFEIKNHYDTKVSTLIIKTVIDTIVLGDGKKSIRLQNAELDMAFITPGVVDIIQQFTAQEIKNFDNNNLTRPANFLAIILQTVVDTLGQLLTALACKALAGNYKHKSVYGGNYNYKFGTPISKTATNKVTANSTILELSAQTDEQSKSMLDQITDKESVRILCSTEYYAIITKIVQANTVPGLVEVIKEPGIKINGWYYINDQAAYIETTGSVVKAVPASGSIMVDISKKGLILFCDLALDATPIKDASNGFVVKVDGIPFVSAYESSKAGLLIDAYYLAAPIAVPRLSKIVHGIAQC